MTVPAIRVTQFDEEFETERTFGRQETRNPPTHKTGERKVKREKERTRRRHLEIKAKELLRCV